MQPQKSNTHIFKYLIPLIVIALVLGYYLVLPAFIVVEKNEEISFETIPKSQGAQDTQKTKEVNLDNLKNQEPKILSQNNFQKAAYDVKGQALVLQKGSQRILRFEDFETINGPKLHIYLVNSTDSSQFYDLGLIKATKGSVNYQIPDNLDLSQYDQVQVYCVPFKKVFSYASI